MKKNKEPGNQERNDEPKQGVDYPKILFLFLLVGGYALAALLANLKN